MQVLPPPPRTTSCAPQPPPRVGVLTQPPEHACTQSTFAPVAYAFSVAALHNGSHTGGFDLDIGRNQIFDGITGKLKECEVQLRQGGCSWGGSWGHAQSDSYTHEGFLAAQVLSGRAFAPT